MKNENVNIGPEKSPKHRGLIPLTNGIVRAYIQTPNGNEVTLFYNSAKSLVTLDLVDGKKRGGNELFRMYMEEDELLEHCNDE